MNEQAGVVQGTISLLLQPLPDHDHDDNEDDDDDDAEDKNDDDDEDDANANDDHHNDEEGHDSAKSSNYKQVVTLVTGKPVNLSIMMMMMINLMMICMT